MIPGLEQKEVMDVPYIGEDDESFYPTWLRRMAPDILLGCPEFLSRCGIHP